MFSQILRLIPRTGFESLAKETGIRHFIKSAAFGKIFPSVTATQLFELIRRNTSWKRRGPEVEGNAALIDGGGSMRTITLDGFCNTHDSLHARQVSQAIQNGAQGTPDHAGIDSPLRPGHPVMLGGISETAHTTRRSLFNDRRL
jgi:hypothetical protein